MIFFTHRRHFQDLSEQEILALAISSEEDDARIFRTFSEILKSDYAATSAIFEGMAKEEDEHRRRLLDLYLQRFGDHVPLIRREHVAGFYTRRPIWLSKTLNLEHIRAEAAMMEVHAGTFYLNAAQQSTDTATRQLLGDLASSEVEHQDVANALSKEHLHTSAASQEESKQNDSSF